MKLTIAWNVWNNYEDLLLGSEIARLQNEELGVFDSLHLISQGGYPEPPSNRESQYIDGHFPIEVNENHKLLKIHVKYKASLRVLEGIRHAYEYARQKGDDFALVTNGDAWCLDIRKLKCLLQEDGVNQSAVSARICLVTGLDSSWGSHAPFFDDHFIILNIALCERHGVFEYVEPNYGINLADWGGVHYMLMSLVDERVPPGLFYSYTNSEDAVNQFGENSGFNLLPWQYQPNYAFLHANCFQELDLHPLRAEMLRFKGLDHYPEVGAYCHTFPADSEAFGYAGEYVYFRQTLIEWARVSLIRWPPELYRRALACLRFRRYAKVKHSLQPSIENTFDYYDLYRHVLPLNLASRRRIKSSSNSDKQDGIK